MVDGGWYFFIIGKVQWHETADLLILFYFLFSASIYEHVFILVRFGRFAADAERSTPFPEYVLESRGGERENESIERGGIAGDYGTSSKRGEKETNKE